MTLHRSHVAVGAALALLVAGCAPGGTADSLTPMPTQPTSDAAPDGPAPLREPDGDRYQAFVVPKPEGDSCTPLADQRAQGQPGLHNVDYDVKIPGVQPITQEWWGAEPVAVVEDEDFDPWYRDLDAWLLADEVSAGNPSPGVGWARDDEAGRWLLTKGVDTPPPPGSDDCDYVLPIPEISGATWLIIEGVDWDTVEKQNPGASWVTTDLMTWVYLGHAD